MHSLTNLFKLAQITRDQPQYGYNLTGIHRHELSDLAQHQYLVTFIAWQLALLAQRTGGTVNAQRIMEISMVHDLGELFGGDICHYYAKANPKARTLAKAYEQENNNFLSQFFSNREDYTALIKEMNEVSTDESLIAKTADYMEVLHYKQHIQKITPDDLGSFMDGIKARAQQIKDEQSKNAIMEFLETWSKEVANGTTLDIFTNYKSDAS